jgi:3-oxoacyl-[acyl-carrier protein] reductase
VSGVLTQADDTTLTDRVAIVTGGSHGLGRQITLELAGRGYAVVVHYARNQAAADDAVEEVLAANGTALAVRGDVADELDTERLFTETTESFGGVDVVVHAVEPMVLSPVADGDLDTFDALLRTSVRGTFLVNRQAAHELRGGGAIVNICRSLEGTYAAANGAVEAITRALAPELHGRDITVNTVVPGLTGPATAPGIASVVAFLVSEDGHWVNGQVIRANDRGST